MRDWALKREIFSEKSVKNINKSDESRIIEKIAPQIEKMRAKSLQKRVSGALLGARAVF